MAKNNSSKKNERVTSTYAEIYLVDEYCKNFPEDDSTSHPQEKNVKLKYAKSEIKSLSTTGLDWISPSDLLIGKVDLLPPFTSKITRGITHEGILKIGGEVLNTEYAKFLKRLNELLKDNDDSWKYILENEKIIVQEKIAKIYNNFFLNKSKIFSEEITKCYEESLHEVEKNIIGELDNVLISIHAQTISQLNIDIKEKLEKEKIVADKKLLKRYNSEVKKLECYYEILLKNELFRYSQQISKVMHERNDALRAFCRIIDTENITSTMYVMSTERKKCKIKKFLLENFQSEEIKEKVQNIKMLTNVIERYKEKDETISSINKKCEDKIKKVLKLFLKFISFSLKLLPEQTTFLLDLEKMVVLQLNEIQNHPESVTKILFDSNDLKSVYNFDDFEDDYPSCDKKPFVVVGDTSPIVGPVYGSRDTLPSNVNLPTIRLDTEHYYYIYGKCHGFEQIKALVESEYCNCLQDIEEKEESQSSKLTSTDVVEEKSFPKSESSSFERILIPNIDTILHCPSRKCQDWIKRYSFPPLNEYLDFTEEKFERVKTILGSSKKLVEQPKLVNPKEIVMTKLPFAATTEPYHHVGTQYSSQEDLSNLDLPPCTCVDSDIIKGREPIVIDTTTTKMDEILNRRRISITRLIHNNPNLLKLFTDESFDFQM